MCVDCHHHGHVLVKCEVQLLLVGISSLGFWRVLLSLGWEDYFGMTCKKLFPLICTTGSKWEIRTKRGRLVGCFLGDVWFALLVRSCYLKLYLKRKKKIKLGASYQKSFSISVIIESQVEIQNLQIKSLIFFQHHLRKIWLNFLLYAFRCTD